MADWSLFHIYLYLYIYSTSGKTIHVNWIDVLCFPNYPNFLIMWMILCHLQQQTSIPVCDTFRGNKQHNFIKRDKLTQTKPSLSLSNKYFVKFCSFANWWTANVSVKRSNHHSSNQRSQLEIHFKRQPISSNHSCPCLQVITKMNLLISTNPREKNRTIKC